jgi:shikimate dehydrogenase
VTVRAGAGTALFGVIGFPLARTLSPPMHNAAFRAEEIPAVYLPFVCPPEVLADRLARLVAGGLVGLNVTAPHKAAVLEIADEADAHALAARSANTLLVRDGRVRALSTDGEGFLDDLGRWGIDVAGSHVAFIGAGGAARAVARACRARGARVSCFARSPARASDGAGWTVHPLDALLGSRIADVDLLVNATPLGEDGRTMPEVGWAALRPGARVYDMVTASDPTPWMVVARARGVAARGGRGMLLHQGARAFTAWTGRRAPLEVMADAIDAGEVLG